jgi:glycosyltransferase involved in cell wall biosynthesis
VSVAEAAACRLPVVASDRVGAAFDLIEPGGNGERYRSGDGSALATAIERALSLDSAKAASVSTRRLEEFGLESTWRGLVSAAASWRRRSLG